MELPTHKFQPIVIYTTHKQRKRAIERADALREEQRLKYGRDHLKGSITKGEGSAVGFIFEEGTTDYYNENSLGLNIITHVPYPESRNYDARMSVIDITLEYKGKSFSEHSWPAANWNGSVACENDRQLCDFYLFGRATKNLMVVVFAGFISRYDFFASQTVDTIGLKGQIEPGASNGFRVVEDCFNVRYDKLWAPVPRDVLAAQLILLQETREIANATNRHDQHAQRRSQERVEAHALLPVCG